MRCLYCARQERASGDGVAVAICKRCGSAICLEHLCEVRRDHRHVGMLGQAMGQSVEMLCLVCAGLAPAETRRPAPTGKQTGRSSGQGASAATLTSPMGDESAPLWADPAGAVVAAEAYLERLRMPTQPDTDTRAVPPTTPDEEFARVEAPSQWWRRWLDSCRRRLASRMSSSQSSQQ